MTIRGKPREALSSIGKSIITGGIFLGLFGGCALPPPAPMEWQRRAETFATTQAWHLRGRLSLSSSQEAWQAMLHWEQEKGQYNILFSSPLGPGTLRLRGQVEGTATLQTATGERLYASDPERLLRRYLGWRLPIAELRYWVWGLADPSLPRKQRFDAAGQLLSLVQSGWRITYRRYTGTGGTALPKKIFFDHLRKQVAIRLVIERWEVSDRTVRSSAQRSTEE